MSRLEGHNSPPPPPSRQVGSLQKSNCETDHAERQRVWRLTVEYSALHASSSVGSTADVSMGGPKRKYHRRGSVGTDTGVTKRSPGLPTGAR
eukprot:scaffold8023_cov103-Isochrysis_galbana.AAC.27